MSKNILTITNSERIAPFEHVRIDGCSADRVKSFTVGDRAYVLADVDAQKTQLADARALAEVNYNNWQTTVGALRKEREAHAAEQERSKAHFDAWQSNVEALRKEREMLRKERVATNVVLEERALVVKKILGAWSHCEVGSLPNVVQGLIDREYNAAKALTKAHDIAELKREVAELKKKDDPRQKADFVMFPPTVNEVNNTFFAAMLNAFDEAGRDARAAGYAINAADKIAEQLRKRIVK